MRKLFLFVIPLLISLQSAGQRSLSLSKQSSELVYVYRITGPEAEELFFSNMEKLDRKYLYQLIDSFPNNSWAKPSLPKGNYLLAKVEKNQLSVESYVSDDLAFNLINNNLSLLLHLHTKSGEAIGNAAVYFNNHKAKYDTALKAFEYGRHKKTTKVKIVHDGVYHFTLLGLGEYIKDRKNLWTHVLEGFPLKYVVFPVRKLIAQWKDEEYREPYRRSYGDRFKGYMVFSKPIYKPLDTLRLKAFIVKSNGTPVNRPLLLRLSSRNSRLDTVLTTINPYRPGAFEYSMLLSDSLRIDQQYQITLEEVSDIAKNQKDHNNETDNKRKVLIRNSFRLEQYQLSSIHFSARAANEIVHRGVPLNLFLKAVDENELPVLDGAVQVIIKPRFSNKVTITKDSVFLPDTLFNKSIVLDPIGETRLTIPDTLFPHANFEFRIESIFLNSAGERKIVDLSGSFDDHSSYIVFTPEENGIRVSQFSGLKQDSVAAVLTMFDKEDDTVKSVSLRLPALVPISPYADYYEVETDSCFEEYKLERERDQIRCVAIRDADSIHIAIVHPKKNYFWYTIMAADKIVAKGYTDKLDWNEKSVTPGNYFVSVQFISEGNSVSRDFAVLYQDRLLDIHVEQPEKVYPGEKTNINLLVTDRKGTPVANADVTAYGFTQKFPRARAPYVPYLGRYYKNRIQHSPFFVDDEDLETESTLDLDWEEWRLRAGLDSMEYYNFLHPEIKYVNTEAAPGNITQIAPFLLKNGAILNINQLYIDNRPVFFNQAEQMPVYSFRASPGIHQLRFRTRGSMITIDSVYMEAGKKTFYSFVVDSSSNRQMSIKTMPDTLTKYEKELWGRYMIRVEDLAQDRLSYIRQAGNIMVVSPSDIKGENTGNYYRGVLTGPLTGDEAIYISKDNFQQSFTPEGGYGYIIKPSLIKQKQAKDASAFFNKFLYKEDKKLSLRDYVPTEGILDSLWDSYVESKSKYSFNYNNPSNLVTSDERGLLSIKIPEADDIVLKRLAIKHIFLFRYDDTDYMESYPGYVRNFNSQPKGWYRLFILLKNEKYILKDSLWVNSGGMNAYVLRDMKVREADSVSRLITVILKRNWMQQTAESKSMNNDEIKSVFNGKFYSEAQASVNLQGQIVSDKDGTTIPGIAILVKGTFQGTISDALGNFSLSVTEKTTLVVSGVGYETTEIRINGNSFVQIRLKEMSNKLQEVVVTALGISRSSKSLGFSVSKVDVTGSLLSGKASGVNVILRGTSSVQMDSQPLVYVDGILFKGSYDKLDTSMIASISILKGEEAVEQFGDKGTNGVVLITLKKSFPFPPNKPGSEQTTEPSSIRKNFRDDAYWQPRLTTDKNGRVSFDVTFPDDITMWRNHFIAMTDNRQSGFAETSIKSYKSVTANINAPVFAVSGDSIIVTGKLLNYNNDSFAVTRQFKYGTEEEERTGVLNSSIVDKYSLKIPATDSLKLSYILRKADGYFDGEERNIPIFRRGVNESKGFFLSLNRDTTLTISTDTLLGKVTVYAERSFIPVMLEEIEKIGNYEYLCNEQIASKLIALLLKEQVYKMQHKEFRERKNINTLIKRLQKNTSEGGLWGWWSNNSPVNWVSLHVLDALLMAQEAGYEITINKDIIKGYLIYQLESEKGSLGIDYLEMLYKLKENVSVLNFLKDSLQKVQLSKMDKYRLMYLRQQVGLPIDSKAIMNNKQLTPFGNYFWKDSSVNMSSTNVLQTLLVYKILEKDGLNDSILAKVRGYFMEERRNGQWNNTLESSSILKTILPAFMKEAAAGEASLTINGKKITSFPFETQLNAGLINLDYRGHQTIYFTSHQNSWNSTPEKVKGNFRVDSYFEQNGKEVKVLRTGQPVTLVVEVDVKAASSYVLVEIPIPSSCTFEGKPISYLNNEVYREYFKNKVSLFCNSLSIGKHQFRINVLPRNAGAFQLNPAKVEMMYFPTVYGMEEVKRILVE